ncbi:MAG: VWA domain-containing protein, partial [Pyrinomonadaceae bacterium]
MKAFFYLAVFLTAAICVVTIAAQSRLNVTLTDIKKREGNVQPSPTPRIANIALPEDSDVIKVNTQLVSLPVRVMDKKGRFIGGLMKENFKVFEDGDEQQIELFSNEHQPFTVALVLDMSYSTKFKIVDIQSAAIAFIDQLRPQDKVMVVSFDNEVHMLCEATSDRQLIYRAIKATKIADGTSLYEAVDLVMNNRLRSIDGRKAIILFTDGVDTSSHRSNDVDNLDDAMELDSLIYTIRYDTFADVQTMKNGSVSRETKKINVPKRGQGADLAPFPVPAMVTPSSNGTTEEEYKKAADYLEQLVTRTGGRLYETTTLTNLADAYLKIASELREFYSIG